MDESEVEDNCFFGDEVTYLKDAGKQPSLNTMIRQDLEHGPPMSEIISSIPIESEISQHSFCRSPIVVSDIIQDRMLLLPLSEDPILSTVRENSSKISLRDNAENVEENISRYSPEIVCYARGRTRKRKAKNAEQTHSTNASKPCARTMPLRSAKPICTVTKDSCRKETFFDAPLSSKKLTCSAIKSIDTKQTPPVTPLKSININCTTTKSTDAKKILPVAPLTSLKHTSINTISTVTTATPASSLKMINPILCTIIHDTDPSEKTITATKDSILKTRTPAPMLRSITPTCTVLPKDTDAVESIPVVTSLKQITPTCTTTEDCRQTQMKQDFYPVQGKNVPSLSFLSLLALSNILHLKKSCDTVQNEPLPSSSISIENYERPWDLNSSDGDFSPDDNDPDFLLDDNTQEVSRTSCESLELSDVQPVRKRKRAKRGKAIKENWLSESNKIKRMKGESYYGRRKTEDGKVAVDIEKAKRSVKCRCEHNESSKFFECYKLTDEMRNQLFKNYWKLPWEGKKVWIQQTVRKQNVVTRKCSGNYRRGNTFKYTFNVSGSNIKVCKKMYLHTLNIGEWSVHNWTKNEDNTEETSVGKKSSRNVNVAALENFGRDYCREFLNKLPKLESHYCRKDTSKLYLESVWQSKRELYREYIRQLDETGKKKFKVSMNIFNEEFDAMNLSLFSPKKDQCDLCCAYNVGNIPEEIYTQHRTKKQIARDEKDRDKYNRNEHLKVFTFDLQAVLLSPALKASALYYKTKLKVHNFTIYDIQTKDAYCFIWNETEGGVSADEFASILHFFLTNHLRPNIKHVILWSDGCTNQNRNAILANSLLQVAVQKGITITQKYLEKGHTQMECDSMHSTIERKLKDREIYSPAQYVDISRTARLENPYHVQYLQHTFFRRFSSMPYLNSIRPGKKPGESTVFDLRCIQYESDGKIRVKKEFTEEFQDLPRRIKKPGANDSMPQLYDSRLPIQRSKYIHLQELKEVIPHDIHSFYDDLPHECPNFRRNENCSCKKTITRAT